MRELMQRSPKRNAGFALVTVLLLTLILVVLGLAFLGSRASLYRSSVNEAKAVQAEFLAWAGLEDARGKLSKDLLFPPPASLDQKTFNYQEALLNPDGSVAGHYRVVVDLHYADLPYQIVLVTSTGLVGEPDQPSASRQIRGEWDAAPLLRDGSGAPNPNAGRWLNLQDFGSL